MLIATEINKLQQQRQRDEEAHKETVSNLERQYETNVPAAAAVVAAAAAPAESIYNPFKTR